MSGGAAARSTVGPILKWAGGKAQLLQHIAAMVPAQFGRYHEPFVGGGAVFFHLEPRRANLSDLNAELINTYICVRDHVEKVIAALRQHRAEEALFYAVRAQAGAQLDPIARAARMLYLNRTCYNGLYRVNRRGDFNVPFGRYKNPTICNAPRLRRAAARLRGVQIRVQSVFDIGRQVRRGDFVYLDPPYDPLPRRTSFVAYVRDGFGREQQERLAALFARLAGRGVHVLLSNADTPFIRQLYHGHRVARVTARRAINSQRDGRGPVGEVLISP